MPCRCRDELLANVLRSFTQAAKRNPNPAAFCVTLNASSHVVRPMSPTELLEAVRRVEVLTNRLVTDTMVGAYLSHFRGRGMDFEELREYMPGDDVRDIDWNVTNRMGRPFVKRFREERELAAVLVLDVSGSSAFGSGDRSKREFAAEVATTLAASAARNGDKVALVLFTEEVELYIPPRKGRRHLLRIVREMLAYEPRRRGTDVTAPLAFLNRVLHRRAMVFLLTDFLHGNGAAAPVLDSKFSLSHGKLKRELQRCDVIQELGRTNMRHDLVCLHLHDPREGELPDAGLLAVEDAETGELLEMDSTQLCVRERFLRANRQRLDDLDRALNRTGVDTLRFNTSEPFAPLLQRFFEIRRGRRRG